MKDVVFYSLYDDPNLNFLKHCLFYFDKLYIPNDGILVLLPSDKPSMFRRTGPAVSQNNFDPHYIELLPSKIYEDVKVLVDEGVVELIDTGRAEGEPTTIQIHEFLLLMLQKLPLQRRYNIPLTSPLLRELRMNSSDFSDPQKMEHFTQILLAITSSYLKGIAVEKKSPCTDYDLVLDLVNLGFQIVLDDPKVRSVLKKANFHDYKANLLTRNLLSLHLPSFQLRSFHDVLELREKFREEMKAFQITVNKFALEIQKSPLDDDFQAYLRLFIENEINPQIEEIKKKMKLSASSFLKQIWISGRKNAGLAALMCKLYPSWTSELILLGGTATFAEAIDEIVSTRKEPSQNGLSFLLKVH